MKNMYSMIACLVFFTGSNYAQTICDSIAVDSVNLQSASQFYIELNNNSTYGCAYPGLSVTLNANPYLTSDPSVSYASWLDYAGGSNNGKTTFVISLTQFTPAASVPLNTVFTGTALLTDPNNPNFSCSLPFQFTYGTMSSSGIADNRSNVISLDLFPNPLGGNSLLQIRTGKGNSQVTILNALGEKVFEEVLENATGEIGITSEHFSPGVYFVRVSNAGSTGSARFVKE